MSDLHRAGCFCIDDEGRDTTLPRRLGGGTAMTPRTDLETLLYGRTPGRPMLTVCPAPGCRRLTMGGTCVEHDAPVTVTFPRGRPFTHVGVESPGAVVSARV
jgi:hypothetical protein